MPEIRSLTHLKKMLGVGDKVITTYHLKNGGNCLLTLENLYKDEVRPVREVIEANTTGFTLATKTDDWWEGRRVEYPKASSCRVDDGKLIIMGEDIDNPTNKQPIKWLTIEVVE